MLNQSHCKLNTLKFQSHLLNWYKFIQPLYQKYVPSSIRHRRNIQHCKLDDVLVISLLCWQVELKITTQFRFYYFLQNNIFPKSSLPERSRFNRICNNAFCFLQWICIGILKQHSNNPKYTIIDSLPLPLCQPIRNKRCKVLTDYADIGYNATKKQYYYGLKGSFEVGSDGHIWAYTLSKASKHDIKMVEDLLRQYRCQYILADQGYLSNELKKKLEKEGIWFWTPSRKNMKEKKQENSKFLKKKRKYIETVFSKLVNLFDIERIRVQSILGFRLRLEQCLLVYTIKNELAQ